MNFLVAFIGLLAQATDVKDTVAEAAAGAASAAPASGSGWITFLIVLACLILPLVIGNAIARAIRLKEYGSKIGVSLLTLVLGLTPFVSRIIQGKDWKEAFKFGIDLAGGTNMTFAVDEDRFDGGSAVGGEDVGARDLRRKRADLDASIVLQREADGVVEREWRRARARGEHGDERERDTARAANGRWAMGHRRWRRPGGSWVEKRAFVHSANGIRQSKIHLSIMPSARRTMRVP